MSTSPHTSGILIDLDDTLIDTSVACANELWKQVPLDDFSSAVDALTTYGMPERVPAWDTEKSHALLHHLLTSVTFLKELPPIPLAREGVHLLTAQIPISGYLTSRLPFAFDATTQWLVDNGFPIAPVIYRFPDTTEKDWKVRYMEKNLPTSVGLIDNELYVPQDTKYKGKLIELVRFRLLSTFDERKIICHNWDEVVVALIASLY